MSVKLNTIRDNFGAKKKPRVVGRGIGSGLGKTSGKGGKGQTARSGVSINGFEGGQTPIFRRLPKRGFNNIHAVPTCEMSLSAINSLLDSGRIKSEEKISLNFLKKNKIVPHCFKKLRIFGDDLLNHPIKVECQYISPKARENIETAGGEVFIITQ
jgi:large subunit ribosomal protein L15